MSVSVSAQSTRGRGRPPAGSKPGERVKDYPQLAIRVPPRVRETLRALGRVTRQPQWRILSDAITSYIESQSAEERALLDGLVQRAEPLLSRPMRERAAAPAPQARILNVDDNDAMLFVKSRYLRDEGYDVLEARTGARALELVQTHPHLVLLDVHLPDANGVEICRRIKSDPRLDRIKVIQMSATFVTPHDQLQGLEGGGADIYLTEPVTRGTLLSVVRRLLAS
jgi:CheY-like chemotaxis protein/predicted transcriptional regulator